MQSEPALTAQKTWTIAREDEGNRKSKTDVLHSYERNLQRSAMIAEY